MVLPAVAWATALFFAELSTAKPVVSFPINSQVPPVARLGEPYSFVFSPTTFTSSSPITYTLANGPSWLSLDSGSRRLFGTPGPGDVGSDRVTGVSLELVASDESGSTSSEATLVVSRNPGPRVSIPLDEQPPEFGIFSAPSAILSAPGESFSFRLDQGTFSKRPNSTLHYYATMADNSPLPAWIVFDPANLSFSGRTPSAESLVQPPQHFAFRLAASDVEGFAGVTLAFDMVVGNHQLVADETIIHLNATPGVLLSFTGLKDTVKVDGEPAAPGSVVAVSTSDAPPWLSVDKHTLHITGVPPLTAASTSFIISLGDTNSSNLNMTIRIQMTGDGTGLFTAKLPKLSVAPGAPFSVDLRPYLSDPKNTEISVETNSSHSWIQLDSDSLTLSGVVPEAIKESAVGVKIIAKSRNSEKTASLSFGIAIRAFSGGDDSTTTGTEPSDGQRSLEDDSPGKHRFNPVLLGVLLPLLLLLGLATCALFWCFRRRQSRQRRAISTRDISGPIPGTFVARTASPGVPHALPDFTKRFGKSFSADDVFGASMKTPMESRNTLVIRTGAPPPEDALPLSTNPSPDRSAPEGDDTMPATLTATPVTLRPGTRGKVSSSLSFITETSIGDLVDSGGLELSAHANRRSFRDKIEINVPTLAQPPRVAYTPSPSPTEPVSARRPGPSRTAPDIEATPPGAESRLFRYPLASAGRKRSWGWLRGVKAKHQGLKLVPGMRRLSEQPSVSTVDTFAAESTLQPSPVTPVTPQREKINETRNMESPSLPLPQFPSRPSITRPPATTGSRPVTRGSVGGAGQAPAQAGATAAEPMDKATSQPASGEGSAAVFPIRGETPADPLDIYDDIAEHNPFRPSATWSTLPTNTDDWVDETVSSLALSRSASCHQQNWTVLQESPASQSRRRAPSGGLSDAASSLRLPLVREVELRGGGEEGDGAAWPSSPVASMPGTATTTTARRAAEKGGAPGLTQKSQSKGVSLRSEGSRSDYAVFI